MKRPDPKSKIIDVQSRALMRWPGLSYAALPLTIMVLVIFVCVSLYSFMSVDLESQRQLAIDRRFQENELRIDAVFNSYTQLLTGSTGRAQSGDTTKESWQKFISIYDLPKNYPGVEAIALLSGSDIATSRVAYTVPETTDTMQAAQADIAAMPGLVGAMKQAAQTGEIVISDTLPDLFSTKSKVKNTSSGFVMFAPFYNDSDPKSETYDRQEALRGYTVALFRGDIFFGGIIRDSDIKNTHLNVYLGEPTKQNLLYETGKTSDGPITTAMQKVDAYGKSFTLVYRFNTASIVPFATNYLPLFVLIGGLMLGMFIAAVAGYMLRDRYQRLTYEKEREVNFAKDELLSLASHQLRTPATGVKQYLGMVLQGFTGDITDQQRIYLERAFNSNNRQLSIINDILHLAKLEAGRIVLSEHKFSIAAMVREVVDEQQDDAKKGNITLTVDTPSRGIISGDSHLLQMVIENLVSNAIKYTEPGGKVTVRLSKRANKWLITVKDTGVGIAKEDYDKLYKQFSRINNSRSDFVTGTGVGLYLAYHLTVLHGGTIGLISNKGKGSTFTVRLPRKL